MSALADPFESPRAFRDNLVASTVRQLFGPRPYDTPEDQTETLTISPLQLYATGVLFPQKMPQQRLEDSIDPPTEDERETLESMAEDLPVIETRAARQDGDGSDEREPLNLANEFSPSAAGISFAVGDAVPLIVRADWATYIPESIDEVHPRAGETGLDGRIFPATRRVQAWRRVPCSREIALPSFSALGAQPPITLDADNMLSLRTTIRRRSEDGRLIYSCMLVNERRTQGAAAPSCADVFFQVALKVSHADGEPVFRPIDRSVGEALDDPELASMDLLFRHRRAFALGHGTAGDWNRDEALSEAGAVDWVAAVAVPDYELKPIRPRTKAFDPERSLKLSMGFLYDAAGGDPRIAIPAAMRDLARDYAAWIQEQEGKITKLTGPLRKAADDNLDNCRACHTRMLRGVDLLEREDEALTAFRLMNKAMFVQQHHSRLPRRDRDAPLPDGPGNGHDKSWYPFQLGFILMNLASAFSADDEERRVVDLIWFPTGGGKTEAYLGLSAFTILLNRLRGEAAGCTVLMRYTLRLLTAQQFQRASALTLAIEALRRERNLGADLGDAPVSIGLWVGRSLSPNTRDDARHRLRQLQQERFAANPFQVLQCPWCGVDFTDRTKLGYQEARPRDGGARTVAFACPDEHCAFSKPRGGLPILVIDEDIYAAPPTILIGTVDKFAQIAWDDRTGRLFGLGTDAPPPALVIQDELHLISGPLGTVVGLYETAIDRLCSRDGHVHKVVASTATIRRAAEQCRDLYARDCFEFPPQAIRSGESYFAFEDGDAPGRRYVGFMGNAVKSHQTALVRACSPLLQNVCFALTEEQERERALVDPYGTLVWYFNSLRELGHAATLCVGDIPEFLKGYCHRRGIRPEARRYIREIVELTSRRGAEEIPAILQQLEIKWRLKPSGPPPVDVLLATNMIAVGVDVARLGVIVMSGQPKGTSEYIQASSRVGRQVPGLVLTVYTQTKSRDRSHYERFVAYHQSLYRHVEPTSVTPFSPQARERGLMGIFVALARLLAEVESPDRIASFVDDVEDQIETILARVHHIDRDEADDTRTELEEALALWRSYAPPRYGAMGGAPSELTLMYPFGSVRDDTYQRHAWPVPTSMRNVDGTSIARVVTIYPTPAEEEA
ncbi:helicase-related protein [Sphingomonas canadensis]|uniref:Helicase-related protein n=1 Tax=Sphingomonas canadensis TaxID=1219257 RepID=A0ABW3H0Q6_9SPHN|nr:helicase-related protein [Sphingomonas canadensis]MCW3835048.1 helicase-related protein [Sphingomonas canadensis]